MLNSTHLVIFDCDGVLVDSEILSTQIFLEKFAEKGILFTEEEIFCRLIGRSQLSCLEVLEEFFEKKEALLFWDDFIARLFQLYSQCLQPVRGVRDLLEYLQENGISFCLASSGKPEKIDMALKGCGLEIFFPKENRFSAVEVSKGKPAPDLFLHVANTLAFKAKNCYVVEDSVPGVEAGLLAGMRVFAFCERSPKRLFGDRPTVIESMKELRSFIELELCYNR